MSRSSSSKADSEIAAPDNRSSVLRRVILMVAITAWVFVSFVTAQIIIRALLWLLDRLNISLASIDETVFESILAALIYLITLVIVVGVPRWVKKRRTSLDDIGLTRLPTWTDIFMAPVGLVVYLILSTVLITLATTFLPWFDSAQAQDTGFSGLNFNYEYVLAFLTLVVVAPLAEEVIFRGYLFGKLKKYLPIWVAIVATSLLFGLVHGAWNLAIDTFALSVVMCLLRQSTGSLWAPILLHMSKNGIAFYFLFINPTLLHTLGG